MISDAVSSGDRLKALRALRDRLASDVDGTSSARDVAPLASRLLEVLGQIAELEAEKPEVVKETGLSDFQKRLAKRQQSTKAAPRAKSG